MIAILAFYILVGPPALFDGLRCEKTRPGTIYVSSIVPPFFLQILISLKSTFVSFLISTIFITASTASGANKSLLADTTLEERDVETQSINDYLSSNYID